MYMYTGFKGEVYPRNKTVDRFEDRIVDRFYHEEIHGDFHAFKTFVLPALVLLSIRTAPGFSL